MASNKPQFKINIDQIYIDKLKYIADKNERSAAAETRLLIQNHIKKYESKHGEIKKEK